MSEQVITVNSRKYDQSIRRSWKCRLSEQTDSLLIVTGEFETAVTHPELGIIERGTISHEYFWLDRWYNVFRFHEPGGQLRNFYCNISMPPTYESGVIDFVDLEIDVLVWRDRSFKVLDMDEFEAGSTLFSYPDIVISNAQKALEELMGMIRRHDFPFAY